MSIFEGVTTSVKDKVDGVRNKFGDVAGFVEAHNPLRKKENPPAAPAYEGPLFLTPEARVENIDVYSAKTQATAYESLAQGLRVEQEKLWNQDFEDDLKGCTDGVTLGRTFVGQAQAEQRVHVRAREYDLGMQTDPVFIPIWNENGRVGGLTALQAKVEARVQEADNKLLIHYMARMMGPVQGAIDAERVQEYAAEITAGNLYPRAPTTDTSSVARQFVQEVFYRVKKSQEEASETESGGATSEVGEQRKSETFDKWLPGAIEALPIPVDMRETLCVRVHHELDQLGVAAEYLSETVDRGDHTSIAQMVGERVNEELMGRSNIAEILQTGEELVRIIGQFADIQHKDPEVRARIAAAFSSKISALREALPQTVPESTQEEYEPDEQRKLLDAIEAQIQIYAAEDTSIETVHETINTIAQLVGLNVQEGDNAEDDSIEQESEGTAEGDSPEAILQEYLRDANQIYHEGIVALEELNNQPDPVIDLEGVAPTDIVRKLLSRKIDAQGRMHESQSRNPPVDPAGIEETVREIELLRVGYVERAREVLSGKRTRVVDALNATLGMQSVINELKVKGMKHGVSPDLISIPLASLTSGEINENIIFQMQERSRNIVDEISQCTKEIALSDPSKWEHSVHKYNTAEAWKARFGKAKPIEAAAQATGLHDRAERRSREAREEVRLALSAVAEFGGGPEQVGPEDAMERLQNSPVLLARIRHVHEDAQKRKGELESQKKELEVMLVYVEKCVERAKELKRALDGYDRRLDALTNENSPIGPSHQPPDAPAAAADQFFGEEHTVQTPLRENIAPTVPVVLTETSPGSVVTQSVGSPAHEQNASAQPEEISDEERREIVGTINDAIEHMTRMISERNYTVAAEIATQALTQAQRIGDTSTVDYLQGQIASNEYHRQRVKVETRISQLSSEYGRDEDIETLLKGYRSLGPDLNELYQKQIITPARESSLGGTLEKIQVLWSMADTKLSGMNKTHALEVVVELLKGLDNRGERAAQMLESVQDQIIQLPAELPPRIYDQLTTAVDSLLILPEDMRQNIKRPLIQLYGLAARVTEGELNLVERAGLIAARSGIPILGPTIEGFSHFIQGAFSIRDFETGKITEESMTEAKRHFMQWISKESGAMIQLLTTFEGSPEIKVAADALEKVLRNKEQETADTLIQHFARLIVVAENSIPRGQDNALIGAIVSMAKIFDHKESNA